MACPSGEAPHYDHPMLVKHPLVGHAHDLTNGRLPGGDSSAVLSDCHGGRLTLQGLVGVHAAHPGKGQAMPLRASASSHPPARWVAYSADTQALRVQHRHEATVDAVAKSDVCTWLIAADPPRRHRCGPMALLRARAMRFSPLNCSA